MLFDDGLKLTHYERIFLHDFAERFKRRSFTLLIAIDVPKQQKTNSNWEKLVRYKRQDGLQDFRIHMFTSLLIKWWVPDSCQRLVKAPVRAAVDRDIPARPMM